MMIYLEPANPVGRFLALSLQGSRTDVESDEFRQLYFTLGTDVCLTEARRNQVEALVAQAVCDLVSSDKVEKCWRQVIYKNERRVIGLTEALVAVTNRLEKVGCRTALVENAGVMFGSRMPLAAFCAGDFDLMADAGMWPAIHEAFRAEGFVPRDRRNRPTNRVEFYRQLPTDEKQWINVGTHGFDRMWVPLVYTDRTQEWLKRRVPSRLFADLYVFAPSDALAFVAMHTSTHSYIRPPGIRLHVDVDRLVRDNSIDWDSFMAEVRAMGVATRAYVSLSMAAGLLGTPVPKTVLEALYPGACRWGAIHRLLRADGVFVTGTTKLPHLKAAYLDALLNEQGLLSWARLLVFPPEDWMREHFDREGTFPGHPWLLHLKRMRLFATEWRH